MNLDFSGRHVLVTGGTGALGAAVVGGMLGAGAQCSLPIRGKRELGSFAHRDHKAVRIIEGIDVSQEAAVDYCYAEAVGLLGPLWAAVHVAGGFAAGPITHTTRADFERMIESNVTSCFLGCREAVKHMGQGGGRIVNVAARPALEPRSGANLVAYTASKAAVAALTTALAEEVAPRGILVNAVVPSIMDTPANRGAMPDADFSKWPKVDEVAAVICFLASPQNRVARGAMVTVYGAG